MSLKIARKIARLSQKRLAALAGIDISAISRFESGDRDLRTAEYDTVGRLAAVFHLEPDELLRLAAAPRTVARAPRRPPRPRRPLPTFTSASPAAR